METSPPPVKETKTIELGTIKLNVAANGNTHIILSKKSEIREKIKEFAEEKTGKNIRTPYYLNDLKYDEEKNMPYYELIEKEDNKEDTFSYYDSIGKDIYKLYVEPNYYYSNERAENPEKYNINTLIEDVKRNNPEITNIEVLSTQSLPFGKISEDDTDDDYNYSSEGKRYVLANVTKNGITTETKIIFKSERIDKYQDIIKINENDFKTRILSEETKNKIKVILKNGYSFTDYTQLFTDGKYQSDIFRKPNSNPVPGCPPTGSWALELPEYGENCSKRLKIIIPNIDDIPNEENCIPNKPNDPITPSNIPSNPKPNGGGITPKQNRPNTPNTIIPKESNTTPNKPSESTPVTIINKTENKNDVGESQFATTLPKQDIPQFEITRNIKTGDIIFVINMTMIFTIFILTTYINFRKYKIFKTHKKD